MFKLFWFCLSLFKRKRTQVVHSISKSKKFEPMSQECLDKRKEQRIKMIRDILDFVNSTRLEYVSLCKQNNHANSSTTIRAYLGWSGYIHYFSDGVVLYVSENKGKYEVDSEFLNKASYNTILGIHRSMRQDYARDRKHIFEYFYGE